MKIKKLLLVSTHFYMPEFIAKRGFVNYGYGLTIL